MCGRYVATTSSAVLADYFEVDDIRVEPPAASWNVAPTDPVPAVVVRERRRLLGQLRWGLVPSWAEHPRGGARLINARAETISTKPAFRAAFARRRCLLPADGFYEWERRADGTKQPWFIHRGDGAPLAMAGVWEVWRPPESDAPLLRTCAVVTTLANDAMAPIHDRMPVLVPPDGWRQWLDPDFGDLTALRARLVPADPRSLERRRVSAAVNDVRNNGSALLESDAPAGSVEKR